MKYKKGQSGNLQGRPKGSQNKTTCETKQWITNFIDGHREQFENDFEQMEPEKRVAIFEKLMSYVVPKQTQVDINQEFKQLEMLLLKAPEKAIEAISLKIIELHNKNSENYENEND